VVLDGGASSGFLGVVGSIGLVVGLRPDAVDGEFARGCTIPRR
jgi:hypothetical protein